jgi:hypothetical protein
MKNQNNTEQSPEKTENKLPWEPKVFSPDEQARLDGIYAEWGEANLAHEAFEKEIGARVTEVWNDNTRRVSRKKGFDLEYSLYMSWSERIGMLLRREKLWDEKDDENKENFKSV